MGEAMRHSTTPPPDDRGRLERLETRVFGELVPDALDWLVGEALPAVLGFALFVGVAVALVRLHACFGG